MTSLSASLVRGAVTSPFKHPGRPGATLPTDRLTLPAAPAAPGPLAAYRDICGFPAPGSGPLPLTYPHVLAFPLAMRLMTARRFPLPVVGLVHTWIEIVARRPVQSDEPLELTLYAAELTPHRRGTEVTMVTEARVAGTLVWESRSGYLSRHATNATGSTREADGSPTLPAVAEWRLPGDLGRRYGAVSGDRNPIHLHPLTARLFGFPRAIAHGMWTVARCLAEADGQPGEIRSVRADFRAPVLLPAAVTYAADPAGNAFALRSESSSGSGTGTGRVHLTGVVTRAS
ncbi:MaoC/PaaZ C-terminal domain-containing protein [Streptomyces cyaneofuscatus]|uniref:MaoC/PaaZ C-terminal domain-containing protein n=1 Tax=Streptomyces cyaneofuscatus TaxID=66883 RepID=UPI002E15DD12|nr:MaoC/PaaZ C-terminal domain-containing protein [Streptomyces cyaneofuscatus]